MIRQLLFAILFAIPFLSFGQQFYGHITNGKKSPVVDAYVSLHKLTDSSMITHANTDQKGYYGLQADHVLPCLLKIQALGYTTVWMSCNVTENNITLQSNNTLKEINVSSRKPVIEHKVDRTIFNVENSASAAGGDAYSTLKRVPNVQVMQGQISVEGKGGVAVMLNGRLQQLTGEDLIQFLHSIPSDNISKIEVITAPGAKYDAEGNSGVINIVTKKNANEGFRGSATAACTRNHYFSPSAKPSLQYRYGKLNLFANANTSVWNWLYTNRAR